MDMHNVVAAAAENVTHLSPQSHANRDASLRSIAVDWLAPADPDYVRLLLRAGDVGGDDVHMVAAAASLAREEVHVLADPPEVRIVILRDQGDPEGTIIPNDRKVRELGKGRMSKGAGIPEGEIQERHGLRRGGRLGRGRESTRRNPSRSYDRTSRSAAHRHVHRRSRPSTEGGRSDRQLRQCQSASQHRSDQAPGTDRREVYHVRRNSEGSDRHRLGSVRRWFVSNHWSQRKKTPRT